MKATFAISLLAILVSLILFDRMRQQRAKPRVETGTVSPGYVPSITTNAGHKLVMQVPDKQIELWTQCGVDATGVLTKYIPDATEGQKRAAQEFVFHHRNRRAAWAAEAAEIKQMGKQLEDPNVTELMRIEVGRMVDTRWAAFVASVRGMAKQLDEANAPMYQKFGFIDPNLQADLYALGNPSGREPWEE